MMILLNSFISQIGTSLILIAVFVTVISQSILEVNSYHHHQPAFISVRNYHRLTFASTTSRTTTTTINMGDDESNETSSISHPTRIKGDPHVKNVLFIECGFGNDSHGKCTVRYIYIERERSYVSFFSHANKRQSWAHSLLSLLFSLDRSISNKSSNSCMSKCDRI